MAVTLPDRELWSYSGVSIDNYLNGGAVNTLNTNSFGGGVWPAANLIFYVPVVVKRRVIAAKMWFGGGSGTTGTTDIGIYNRAGSRLVNVSATKEATTGIVIRDITDTTIGPDLYYIGMSHTEVTSQFGRQASTAPASAALGVREQAGSGSLPATATWTINSTRNYCPVVGILIDGAYA
jgi:hypothetical protein